MITFGQHMDYKPLMLVVARGMVRLVAFSRLRVMVPWALFMLVVVFVLQLKKNEKVKNKKIKNRTGQNILGALFYKMVYIKVADNSVWAMREQTT